MYKKILQIVMPGTLVAPVFLAIFTVVAFFIHYGLGVFALILTLLSGIAAIFFYRYYKKHLSFLLETGLLNADTLSSRSMISFPLPMVVVRRRAGEIIWCNDSFRTIVGKRKEVGKLYGALIEEVISGFELNWITRGPVCPYDISYDGKIFTVFGAIYDDGTPENADDDLVILYWQDRTEMITMERHMQDKNVLCAEIVFDNFDEVMSSLPDSRRTEIQAAVERDLAEWCAPAEGILRRLERDRFLFVFEEKYYRHFAEDHFSIRKVIHQNQVAGKAGVTLSMGVGRDGQNLRENMANARLALDMALSRGGDQTVVRSRTNFDFFGGDGNEYEKRTKVKSRLMANALEGLIKDASSLYVMGHGYADNDSLGAAAGVVCMGRKYGKPTRIIIDEEHTNAAPMLAMLKREKEYADVFINPQNALVEADASSLLIVVDTNRPMYVQAPEVLKSFNRLAVIDHHRRAAEYIENAALNIHEPSASSASEIVVELLQYLVNQNDVLKAEGVALLAGISLDTKSFSMKTGVRTFAAASFLRRTGADMIEVKHLFQNDFDTYLKRSDLIRHTTFYEGNYALVCSPDPVDNVIAAQAADELLSVIGVRASFVVFPQGNQVRISARSLGEVNVQLILEKLGGGGHLTTAGAQITNISVEKALHLLKEAIDIYASEN